MKVWEPALFCSLVLLGQSSIPNASELHDPPGYAILFKLRTLPASVQIYTCKPATGWTGPDPDAIVAGSDTRLPVVHHYRGPTWESTDGSIVRGGNAKHYRAPKEKSVDWLELTASSGTQKFANVSFIHPIDTSGGVAPAQPCDATHDQEQVRVPYSATYLFYAPKP